MDVVTLDRLQFGLTISFHFIFPAVTVGLAGIIAIVETLRWRTKRDVYDRYVVGTGPAADPASFASANGRPTGAAAAAGASAAAPWGTTETPTTLAADPGAGPGADGGTGTSPDPEAPRVATRPETVPATVPSTEPDTAPPTTPTTVPTTNPQPEVHVPRNWPKGAQLPPIPANCREPQLTWDGVDTSTAVWHCDD